MSRCTRQCCALHQAQRRAHIDIPSRETYSTVEPVFTMSSYTRQWFWCNVQHCRVGLHDVELHSTLVLVHPTAQSCRSSRCRATLENDSGAPYSAVGSVFTMSSYTRQWFLCNVQRYRVSLHDVELHSTMVLVQRTAISRQSSRCRVTPDTGSCATYSDIESVFTMSGYTRQWFLCNVQRCRFGLQGVELHSTMLCVTPDLVSI